MNWQQQTEDMFKAWTDSQKKVWENWNEAMKGFGTVPNNEIWGKTLDTWHSLVQNSLESQSNWSKTMSENVVKVEGLPAPVVEWTKKSQEMNTQWNQLQKQLWDSWFEMVKKMEPSAFIKLNGEDGKNVFQAWQDNMQQMMKTQNEWVNEAATTVKKAAATATATATEKK